MKYELRNISSTSKTVELNHLPEDEHGGGDNMLSEGAVFKDKQWMGQCLAPAPELPDTLFMTFFPYWEDSEPMHYFDIEINGELFDLSSISKLTETQNFPPEAIGLTNYIKLYHTANGWPRLFVRNVTNEPLHVKFIRRNDWRNGTWFDDVERATLKLMDDRRNPSIRYHEDESFEFDLAPYIPFDQVPEKDKMILELDFQEDGGDLEWLYLEIINQDDVHKDDYVFIDWGNGSTDHIKFIEQGTDSSSDFMETYAFWEREPDRLGRHTIKLHCSHPFQYLMIMNVAKVIQWGSYIAEEIYGFAVRWGNGNVLESLPNEKMPEWITWIDFDEEYQEEMKFKVQNLDVPFTMSYINYNGGTRVWNGYGRVDKFLDYNNYTGEINGADITWGEYPDEYPFTGFDVNDIDQLGIILTAGPGQGVGLSAQLDFKKRGPGNLIGTARPDNESTFVEWQAIPDKEQIHFLIDMNEYFDGGFAKEDFLCYIRAFFTASVVSGRIHAQFFGWKNAGISLGDNGLDQYTQTALYETEGNLQSEVVSDNPLTAGARTGVIHYDPYLNLIIPKPMNMVMDESTTWKQDREALDIIDITGAPGASITLNVLYSDEGSTNQYSYTLDDSGHAEHIVEFKNDRGITINGDRIRRPQDGLSYPQYNIAGKNVYMGVASFPGEVYYTVNGVTASDPVHTSEIVRSRYVRLRDSVLVAAGVVQARIIYTSPRTGRVYDCAGNIAGNRVVEFEDSDLLRLAVPKTTITGNNQYVFGIENKNVYLGACYATPGEPMYDPTMYQVDTGTIRRYYFSGYGGPLSSSGADEKIVEFILYDGTYKAVRGAGKGIGFTWGGRVLQFPRTMNGWQFVLEWRYPTNGLSAVPTSIPEEFVNLSNLYSYNTNLNEATQLAIAEWDVRRVVSFNGAFAYSNFNGPIENWKVLAARDMISMFSSNKVFNRDLSQWCVPYITDLPNSFAANTVSFPLEKHPVWGTCPTGEVTFDPQPNELWFKTIDSATINIYGEAGDEVLLADGTHYTFTTSKTQTVGTSQNGIGCVRYNKTNRNSNIARIWSSHITEIISFPTIAEINNVQLSDGGLGNGCNRLEKVPAVLPRNITSLKLMFYGAHLINDPNIALWDVSHVTDMSNAFTGALVFNIDITGWDVSNVTTMGSMFSETSTFNQPIGSWDVSKVTNFNYMFVMATGFTQSLVSWCVPSYSRMPEGFNNYAPQFTTNLHPVWGTCPVKPGVDEIPSNEMQFTTTTGTIDYYGVVGDQIVLNNGTTLTLETDSMYDITVPSGKHKLVLVETRSQDYVGLGGEALVEINNFPTLSSVNTIDTCPNNSSPNLVKVPMTLPPNITHIQYMFSGATSFNQDISMWDTSNVIHMFHTFSGASAFNQDISGWDTGNVTDMYNMFENAIAFNQDLSQWCVPLISSLPSSFATGSALITGNFPIWGTCPVKPEDDEVPSNEMYFTTLAGSTDYVGNQGDQILLSDGNIVEVTATDETITFDVPAGKHKVKLVESVDRSNFVSVGGEALVELHNFPTLSTITKFNFSTHEYNDTFNLTKIPEFFPSNIVDIEDLFNTTINFNQDISMWDVSNVKIFDFVFSYTPLFNHPLNDWDVSGATSMRGLFCGAPAYNHPLDSWDVSNVTNMYRVFDGAELFNQDISMWNVSSVTDMSNMFCDAKAFNQDITGWDVSNVTNMWGMFDGATTFNQPIGSWDTSNVTEMYGMFRNTTSFNQPIGNWDVSKVTYLDYMFYGATAFNQDLSQWCVVGMNGNRSSFDIGATSWTLPRPVWGTCPRGENLI